MCVCVKTRSLVFHSACSLVVSLHCTAASGIRGKAVPFGDLQHSLAAEALRGSHCVHVFGQPFTQQCCRAFVPAVVFASRPQESIAVFIDWCSLHQAPRSDDEAMTPFSPRLAHDFLGLRWRCGSRAQVQSTGLIDRSGVGRGVASMGRPRSVGRRQVLRPSGGPRRASASPSMVCLGRWCSVRIATVRLALILQGPLEVEFCGWNSFSRGAAE